LSIPAEIREQALSLRDRLSSCDLCPRRCGVNRLDGETGFCKTAHDVLIAHIGLHFGEEPPLSGSRGSGTIFFASCNLRCVFCQNYQISQCFDDIPIWLASPQELADRMLKLQDRGAHNVNWVSPTHVVAQAAEALCIARDRGLAIPVIYNTNGYDAVDSLQCLEGLVEIYLPDIKYSDNEMAKRYSGVDDYVGVNRQAIAEMYRQVGTLRMDRDGIAQQGVLVRHLVLPQDAAGSEESLRFLASISTDIAISLMSQYSPQYKARSIPPLDRRVSVREYERVVDHALELGLENCFIQQLGSSDVLVPNFRKRRPFAGS
jgi:putative pyruvate formate lyase activating enzyme